MPPVENPDLYSEAAELDLIKQSLSICFDGIERMLHEERRDLWLTLVNRYYEEHYERVRKIKALFKEKRKGRSAG